MNHGIMPEIREVLTMSEKVRFQMRISPDTDAKIKESMPLTNCQSKNEFVEEALRFYCGYLSASNALEILPPIFAAAIQGTIKDTENHIARLLFKQAVELDMVMNVVAAGLDIDDEALKILRAGCIQEVKKTGGTVTFADAVKYQNGG